MRQRAINRNPTKKTRSVSVRGFTDGLLAKLKVRAKTKGVSLARHIVQVCETDVATA